MHRAYKTGYRIYAKDCKGKAWFVAEGEAIGILNNTGGADIETVTEALTYDDVLSLYFSVPSEYRKNGVWFMNDKTVLRKMKASDSNYL